MIQAIAFKSTPTVNSQKKTNNTPAQIGMGLTAVGGGIIGGIGVNDYNKTNSGLKNQIALQPNLTKTKLAESLDRIMNDSIQKSKYVHNHTQKIKTNSDLQELGFQLQDILTKKELESYNKVHNIKLKDFERRIKEKKQFLNDLVDKFIRESDYAKEHPQVEPYTMNEVLGNDPLNSMLDILSQDKYDIFDPLYDSKLNELKLLEQNKDFVLEQLRNDTIYNCEYNKNIPSRDCFTIDEIKKQGLSFDKIFTPKEAKEYIVKHDAEEKRLKELEQKTIKELEEKLKTNKIKNLYKIAGAGFGIAFVSLLSLFLLKASNRKTKNAN